MTLPPTDPTTSPTSSHTQNGNAADSSPSRQLMTPEVDHHSDHHSVARDNSSRDVNWSDPQTRAILDQIVVALQSDAAGGPPSSGTATSRYGTILRRRWKPMLLALVLAVAAVTWRLRPDDVIYTAKTQMLLPQTDSSSSPSASPADFLGAISGTRDFHLGSTSDTQIAIITSPSMIKQALSTLPPALRSQGWESTDPPAPAPTGATRHSTPATWSAWWNPKWGVPADGDPPVTALANVSPDIIDITVVSHDSEASVKLANRMVDTYVSYIKSLSNASSENALVFTKGKLVANARSLEQAKRDLRAYQEKTGVADLGQEQTLITSRLSTLRDAAIAARQEADAGETSDIIQHDGTYTSLKERTDGLQADYQNLLRTFRPNAPEAQTARHQYENARQQSDVRLSSLLHANLRRASETEAAYSAVQSRASQLPKIQFDLDQLQGRISELQSVFQTLSQRYTALSIANSATPATPSNLAPAVASDITARTWGRVGAIALLAGLTLAVLLASILEALDHSLHGADDVEALPGANLLGALPRLRGRTPRNLGLLGDAAHAALNAPDLLELCRILRSNLTFASPDEPMRSVLVTSADAGEGKSLCACNLAAVLAFDGRRVLLLDGDLRRPAQHKLAGVDMGFGWVDILNNGAALEDAIRPTATPNLSLLTAGTLTPNPTELLNSARCSELFKIVQSRFDVVVVDSPPALALADAQLWASMCDATVIVARADSTHRSRLLRAQGLLRHAGGRVLGIVLNRVRSRADYGMGGYGAEYAGTHSRFKLPAPAGTPAGQ